MSNMLLYSLAVGMNRGTVMVLIPVLATVLTVQGLADFSLYLVTASLLLPILSLNISSVVGREFDERKDFVLRLVNYGNLFLSTFLIMFLVLFSMRSSIFSAFTSFLFAESLFLVNSNYSRFAHSVKRFFIVCLMKSLGVLTLLVVLISQENGMDLERIFILLALTNLIGIGFSGTYRLRILDKSLLSLKNFILKNRSFLLFGIVLIPHGISQWIISGSDRYILKWLGSDHELASYSLAYSWAAFFMLINGALALGIPHIMVKNYKRTMERSFQKKYYGVITLAYLFTALTIYNFIPIFYTNTHYSLESLRQISQLVLSGLFLLGFYYYYSGDIFYHKKAKTLSFISLIAAVINILLSVLFYKSHGILGVAIATYATYFFYLASVAFFSSLKHYKYLLLVVIGSLVFPLWTILS